ncbi:MAG: transglycosylase SLT domain-containing protein [Candidatus Dojkabacteria bacterium]
MDFIEEDDIQLTQDQNRERTPTTEITFRESDQAQELAEVLGITYGTFFKIPDQYDLTKINAINDAQQLLPIFPPSVIGHKALIYKLSSEYDVPVNVIATIMTIESCGYDQATSYVGAAGLFQVMPFHFKEADDMYDHLINGRKGMEVLLDFKNLVNNAVKGAESNWAASHDDVRIWARALMGYNGGNDAANVRKVPNESWLYGDHFIRFALTAEIAQKLREEGLGDFQIIQALRSNAVDLRSYYLSQLVLTNPNYDHGLYNFWIKQLAQAQVDTEILFGANRGNQEEFRGYDMPLSPGMRIWTNGLGGLTLFLESPENSNFQSWEDMDTSNTEELN